MERQKDSFLTPLDVRVMDSGKRFRLLRQFTYIWKRNGWSLKITVPVGFITDFASIPRLARVLIPKLGKYNKAAVIHDFLYKNHMIQTHSTAVYLLTRKQADLCFLDGMRDRGVVKWKRTVMYWAVRLFGYPAWRKR